ncbi:MAG: hypothetical protein ABEI58_03225 [Candidatus Nanohaloarchaea archaeon]
MTIRMEEEVKKFIENPDAVLKKVDWFRKKTTGLLEELLRDTEKNIENSLVGTEREPSIYLVITPNITEVRRGIEKIDPDRFLLALSVAFFEYSQGGGELFDLFRGTPESETGKAAEGLYNAMEQDMFGYFAKYGEEDGSIWFNEFPPSFLPDPDRDEFPPVLAFLWNVLNTNVDAGTGRNYGVNPANIEVSLAHEMTHAYNDANTHPRTNAKTEAIDEAAAMATSYAIVGRMTDDDYEDIGLDPGKMALAKEFFADLADSQGSRGEKISALRAESVRLIEYFNDNPRADFGKILKKEHG